MPFRIASATLLLCAGSLFAADLPTGEAVIQPQRWRPVRQAVQLAAEHAGFRWAMPNTIGRKVYVGNNDGKPIAVADLLRDIESQTGLKVELLNGVVMLHDSTADKRGEWVAAVSGLDRPAALIAISKLGWSRDGEAWPHLAKLTVGGDVELSLSAAQALRRLEGEKPLDWRLHGVTPDDPEYVAMTEATTQWQVPLGMAYPQTVKRDEVEKLAASPYVPLREAAARLSASLGKEGKAICEKLAADRSPIVKAAAERTLAAWAEPVKGPRPPRKRDGQKFWWEQPLPDLKDASKQLHEAKAHDTMWRLIGRRVAYESTPAAIDVMLAAGREGNNLKHFVTRPLAEWCGGPNVIDWLKITLAKGDSADAMPGWALWGITGLQDGEELAKSLRPALESRASWAAPPEYTAAMHAGRAALPAILSRMEQRGHWVCLAAGHIGGPEAVMTLIGKLNDKDPGIAVAAAKGLGETGALAAVKPLIAQLKHDDRLRRHWAVLGLGKIGGPEAAQALTDLLKEEEKRKDRLVRKAAALLLLEMRPFTEETKKLIAAFEDEDFDFAPEYRPRNPKFGADFPINEEVAIKEHKPVTYCSIGETRAAMDTANRLMFRYGGCTGAYSNEFFAFDVGSATWFPIRAADQYCALFNEIRPNPGCSRGMCYDGIQRWVWIGQGIGGSSGPTLTTHNLSNGLAAYDATLDRFYPCTNGRTMAKAYSGEPAKMFAFNSDAGAVFGSTSGGLGISVVNSFTLETSILKAPEKMPAWDQYRPPAFNYDPIAKNILVVHPELGWKTIAYDPKANSYRQFAEPYPGEPSKQIMGGLVFDSVNKEMILVGGVSRDKDAKVMPTCRLDRANNQWIDLHVKNIGQLANGMGTCVYDPEHNVIHDLRSGAAYRYKNVPVGTKAFVRTE